MTEPTSHRESFFLSGWFSYSLYLLLALVLLVAYRFQLNPDAVSYFTVATEYWQRVFPDAINGYWSPLYSWLLAPLLGMGIGGPLAARLLAIPIGAGVIFAADRLVRRLDLADDLRRTIRLALVLPVAALGFIVITPDLLATWLTLLYLLVVCSPKYMRLLASWALAGILGAFLYLAKAYAMWFFVGHFIILHALWYWRMGGERLRVMAALLVGLIFFILVSAPWVAALSWKYGHFVLNTSGKYNHAIEAPDAPDFPPTALGLLPPPTRMAVSVWEDPSMIDAPDWNEFANGKNLRHFMLLIARNIADCTEEFCCYSIFLPAIAVIAAIVVFRLRWPATETALALAVILYPLGYLLRHVEQRFLSAPAIVLILLGVFLIDRAARVYSIPRAHRMIAIWVLALSLLPNPIWNIIRYSGHEGQRLKMMAGYVSRFVPAHADVASDSDWFTSMYASYYADLRYYGVPRPGESAGDFAADVHRQQIQYLLVWDEPSWPFLKNWRRINPTDVSPAIYEVGP